MNDREMKLVFGSLLHDIGKVVHRSGNSDNHSESGYDFLKNNVGFDNADVLNCVKYHHSNSIKSSELCVDNLAYITYIADNIASGIDRRHNSSYESYGFDKKQPLESVFNILNGNNEKKHYRHNLLDISKGVIYPTDGETKLDTDFYSIVVDNIKDSLRGIEWSKKYINSLLSVLEANLSFIPSSTNRTELADISLYDHLKLSAAIASSINSYLVENNISNYRKNLFENAVEFYNKKTFLLFSMDISGIQSFIYNISSKGALKSLRARSFYLDILMESIVDDLLDELDLTRANLIYSGGGHTYIILPNTNRTKDKLASYEKKINDWFIENFDIQLYIASGYVECSSMDLRNEPEGSYEELYRTMSKVISSKKSNRYEFQDIVKLNSSRETGKKECKICRRVDRVDVDSVCSICHSLRRLSREILENNENINYKKDYFVISHDTNLEGVILPNNKVLFSMSKSELKEFMKKDSYVRTYTKNKLHTGKDVDSNLWVGDYTLGQNFDELEQQSKGIKRLGVLRADIDNLGTAFVSGFKGKDGNNKNVTLSRTATLSRNLSLFFKGYINNILSEGKYNKLRSNSKRNVSIVYSGGDDVFLVGAWNDIISAAIDLRDALKEFTQGTLTISAGITIHKSGYPVNIMAKDTAKLEDVSKGMQGKDSITIFNEEHSYKWDDFKDKVIGEKMELLNEFFEKFSEKGNSLIYNLLNLVINSGEKINFARYVYLLSRLEPDINEGAEKFDIYRHFSKKMYEWIQDDKDRQELITAMYIYVYLNRDID